MGVQSHHARQYAKPRTVPLQSWVHPLIKAEIQRIAERERLSISAVVAALLEKAIRMDIHTQHDALLQPMLRQLIREELRTFGNRIVFFLMRIAFASEQSRILVTNVLDRILKREGVEGERLYSLLDQSNKLARRNILQKTPQLTSLLHEWEASFSPAGEAGHQGAKEDTGEKWRPIFDHGQWQ